MSSAGSPLLPRGAPIDDRNVLMAFLCEYSNSNSICCLIQDHVSCESLLMCYLSMVPSPPPFETYTHEKKHTSNRTIVNSFQPYRIKDASGEFWFTSPISFMSVLLKFSTCTTDKDLLRGDAMTSSYLQTWICFMLCCGVKCNICSQSLLFRLTQGTQSPFTHEIIVKIV